MKKNFRAFYDWPGCRLRENPYGKDFDLDGRRRMHQGSLKLLPLIRKYKQRMGNVILEIGPLFLPLVTPSECPNRKIIYLDKNQQALQYLRWKYPRTTIIKLNLNSSAPKILTLMKPVLRGEYISSIVVSQVFNYVDYRKTLRNCANILPKGGLLFVNNVPNNGINVLFSAKRPRSNPEIINSIIRYGFKIIEKKELNYRNNRSQKLKRLLLIARRK